MQNALAFLGFYAEGFQYGQIPLDVMPFGVSMHPTIKQNRSSALTKADAIGYAGKIQQQRAPE